MCVHSGWSVVMGVAWETAGDECEECDEEEEEACSGKTGALQEAVLSVMWVQSLAVTSVLCAVLVGRTVVP